MVENLGDVRFGPHCRTKSAPGPPRSAVGVGIADPHGWVPVLSSRPHAELYPLVRCVAGEDSGLKCTPLSSRSSSVTCLVSWCALVFGAARGLLPNALELGRRDLRDLSVAVALAAEDCAGGVAADAGCACCRVCVLRMSFVRITVRGPSWSFMSVTHC